MRVSNRILFALTITGVLNYAGCPMDFTDNNLRGINNSSQKIRFTVKTLSDQVVTWADVNPRSESEITLVNRYWDDLLATSTSSISVFCVRTTWWDSVKNWNQVNRETAIKYLVLSRSQLDSIHWKIVYP